MPVLTSDDVAVVRAAATHDVEAVAKALDAIDGDPASIAARLLSLHVGRLVVATVGTSGHAVAEHITAEFERRGLLPFPSGRDLLDGFSEARDTLGHAGIDVLLLKGVGHAVELYDGIDHRPQNDIDLLVHRRDARRAERALRATGYRRLSRDAHAVTLQRDPLQLDVHRALRSAPAYRIDERAVWETARDLDVDGVLVRAPSAEIALSFSAISLVEDTAFGMGRLKSACDVWLLTRLLDPIDWERWYEDRARERTEGIAVNGIALALYALGVTADAPRAMDAIGARRDLVRVRSGEHARELLRAEKGSPAAMAWMGEIYRGSLLAFRMRPLVAGLPWSMRDVRKGWLARQREITRHRRKQGFGR